MHGDTIERPVTLVAIVGFLVGWPLFVRATDLPVYAGTALWVAAFLVLFWLFVRPLLFPRL